VGGLRDPKMFACVLALRTNEVMSCFPSESAPKGNTEKHLLDYLNENVPQDESAPKRRIQRIGINDSSISSRLGRTPGLGRNEKNKKIAGYFLAEGIKAVRFFEHGEEVVPVYDPNCIRVLPKSTNFELHPFSDFLAANEPGPV
jgi:hypothetical protein